MATEENLVLKNVVKYNEKKIKDIFIDLRCPGRMDGWVDGRIDGWMDGWMERWTD